MKPEGTTNRYIKFNINNHGMKPKCTTNRYIKFNINIHGKKPESTTNRYIKFNINKSLNEGNTHKNILMDSSSMNVESLGKT
jgi:hypothetical protein